MNNLNRLRVLATVIPALAAMAPNVASADVEEPQCFSESRSGVSVRNEECSTYHSEISDTRAFLETVVKRGKWTKRSQKAVIIDVRSTPEYRAGHPEHAYNVPYPYIYQYCNDADDDGDVENDRHPDGACVSGGDRISQPDADFVSDVERLFPDKDTPIYTMCRTGVRSVGAANRLEEAGYTNVRNMWEGFVGIYLEAPQYVFDENGDQVFWDDDGDPTTDEVPLIEDGPVDLNHDGELTDEDKNGWRYHLGLPYDTRLIPKLIYQPYSETYEWD